jgi:predicted metal-dependent hydrolase
MVPTDAMKFSTQHRVRLGGRVVDYRIVRSRTARKLRVRVGPEGVEVVQPISRNLQEVQEFLAANARWVVEQIDRAEQLRRLRRATRRPAGEILLRGEPTRVRIEATTSRAAGNLVRLVNGEIVVWQGAGSRTRVARSLELWLRREARRGIESHLEAMTARLGHLPERVYVMGQRTKWGNCSSRRNLSFNWRLILAPYYVLRYLVTHEAAHLAIPDHSAKFWLAVQSLCLEAEKARQWLCSHQPQLTVDLLSALAGVSEAKVRAERQGGGPCSTLPTDIGKR